MLYDYVSLYDLLFDENLGCNSQGIRECKQKASLNEPENQFFWLNSRNFSNYSKERHICDALPSLHHWLKICRNWTSFGRIIHEKQPKMGPK